jgi:hypothetical protein
MSHWDLLPVELVELVYWHLHQLQWTQVNSSVIQQVKLADPTSPTNRIYYCTTKQRWWRDENSNVRRFWGGAVHPWQHPEYGWWPVLLRSDGRIHFYRNSTLNYNIMGARGEPDTPETHASREIWLQ